VRRDWPVAIEQDPMAGVDEVPPGGQYFFDVAEPSAQNGREEVDV
jgi:hypothetical protein